LADLLERRGIPYRIVYGQEAVGKPGVEPGEETASTPPELNSLEDLLRVLAS
jgi:hypothetical protein